MDRKGIGWMLFVLWDCFSLCSAYISCILVRKTDSYLDAARENVDLFWNFFVFIFLVCFPFLLSFHHNVCSSTCNWMEGTWTKRDKKIDERKTKERLCIYLQFFTVVFSHFFHRWNSVYMDPSIFLDFTENFYMEGVF